MSKPEGAQFGRGDAAARDGSATPESAAPRDSAAPFDAGTPFDDAVPSGEIALSRAEASPPVMHFFAFSGLLLSLFYTCWFLLAYGEPRWTMAGPALAMTVLLVLGFPLSRGRHTTVASLAALTLMALMLVWFTAVLSTGSNAHLGLLAVGFAQLALVPEYWVKTRVVFSVIFVPSIIACEFVFRPELPLSLEDATRDGVLSTVNVIWTVVLVVGATGIIRYRNSHRQQDLSGAAELGERRANTDPMTGIANRRPAIARMSELDDAGVRGFAIALIDIDSFKSINDRHGHEQGDELIRALTARMRGHFRQSDLVSRWGGDEFLVVLPPGDAQEIVAVLERLRASVAASPLQLDHSAIDVTLSIGVAIAQPGMTARQTSSAADEALYRAKHSGRDRVILASSAGASVARSA